MQENNFILELHEETIRAVNIYWNKFFSIRNRYTKEDIVHDIILKSLKPDRYGVTLYQKYSEGKVVGGLRAFAMLITSRFLTDMVRTQKNIISMEKELADGLTVLDTMADTSESFESAISGILERVPEWLEIPEVMWNTGAPVYARQILYKRACGLRTTEICKEMVYRPQEVPVLDKDDNLIGWKNKPMPSKVSSTFVYNIIQDCRAYFDDVLEENREMVKAA